MNHNTINEVVINTNVVINANENVDNNVDNNINNIITESASSSSSSSSCAAFGIQYYNILRIMAGMSGLAYSN